jgi:DNA excision repair protein ERCC-4
MCSDAKECRQLREYLQSAGRATGGEGGDAIEISDDDSSDSDNGGKEKERAGKTTHSASHMMRRRLRGYLSWKRDLVRFKAALNEATKASLPGGGPGSNIQKRNQESFRGRAPANKRRRMRGGSSAAGSSRGAGGSVQTVEEIASAMADLWRKIQPTEEEQRAKQEVAVDPMEDMEDYFELFEMENLVVVHPFRGDMDDRLLEELRPRWIVMYNPDTSFVRRVEVYRSSHEERQVKVFFMFYGDSVEEQRFLSMVRREKDAFSRLVNEKAVSFPACHYLSSIVRH